MKLDQALGIPGWMTPDELAWLAYQASTKRAILEVGSWKGRSLRAMADNSTAMLVSVDCWEPTYLVDGSVLIDETGEIATDSVYRQFCTNMAGIRNELHVYRMTSAQAAPEIMRDFGPVFDMIFLDADHLEPIFRADLVAYLPLLAPGGLICGHDYGRDWPAVRAAVDELLPTHGLAVSIWYATGRIA